MSIETGGKIPEIVLCESGELFPNRTAVLLEPNPEAKLNQGGLNPVVVFSGETAVGKDFLAEQLKKCGMPGHIIGFGDMLSQALGVPKNVLASYKPEELERYYPDIVKVALDNTPTLLTAHPVFKQSGTLCFTPGIYTAMDPVAFVVITSEADQVNIWREERQTRTGRASEVENPVDIRLMQNVTQAIIYTFARSNGAGLITVRNTMDNLDTNIDFIKPKLTSWLDKYCITKQ